MSKQEAGDPQLDLQVSLVFFENSWREGSHLDQTLFCCFRRVQLSA